MKYFLQQKMVFGSMYFQEKQNLLRSLALKQLMKVDVQMTINTMIFTINFQLIGSKLRIVEKKEHLPQKY